VALLRRCVAALTVAFVLATSAGLFAPAAAHTCTDHVCACRRAAEPAREAGAACHESTSPASASLQSTCDHHRQDAAGGAGTLLEAALLPPAPVDVTLAKEAVPPRPAPQPRALASVPEAPPPRSASC